MPAKLDARTTTRAAMSAGINAFCNVTRPQSERREASPIDRRSECRRRGHLELRSAHVGDRAGDVRLRARQNIACEADLHQVHAAR